MKPYDELKAEMKATHKQMVESKVNARVREIKVDRSQDSSMWLHYRDL